MANPARIDPNVGIPDLVRRLTDDSKSLVSNEVRLAKIEVRDGLHLAARGAIRLALAFGIGVVAMVAFTIFLVSLIGQMANGHYWLGALVVGIAELVGGALLVKRGFSTIGKASFTLAETRASLKAG